MTHVGVVTTSTNVADVSRLLLRWGVDELFLECRWADCCRCHFRRFRRHAYRFLEVVIRHPMLHLPDEFLEPISRAVASLFTSACFPIVRRDMRNPRIDDAADVDVAITFSSRIQQFRDAFQLVQRANQYLMGFHVVFWNFSFSADALDGRLERIDACLEHLIHSLPQGAVDAAHIVRLDDQLLTVDDFLRWIREDVGQFSDFVDFVQLDVGSGIFEF